MPRVHPKVAQKEAQKILNNESILSNEDRKQVEQLRARVESIQQEVQPFLQEFSSARKVSAKLDERFSSTNSALQTLTDVQQDLMDGYKDVESALNGLLPYLEENIIQLGNNVVTLEDLIKHFGLEDEDINSQTNKEILLEKLAAHKEVEQQKCAAIDQEREHIASQMQKTQDRIDSYHGAILELQNSSGVKFDVNSQFELTKISKQKTDREGPEFSVIFAKREGVTRPFILYRGKEYEGEVRRLGQGGFGTVKLAQDYDTNELVAVKIQRISHLPEAILQKEKDVLQEMDHFKGTTQREDADKDYIVQELHYGSELESTINAGGLEDASVVTMLKQAAIALQSIHDSNRIHRDIKLENFIWDEEMSKCILIDFAFIEKVEGDKIINRRDEAGSEGYLSPEAKNGEYSKRSDIYAFGILMKEVLDKHPAIYKQLKNEIDKLTKPSLEERATSLTMMIAKLSKLSATLTTPTTRPSAITNQHELQKLHSSLPEKVSSRATVTLTDKTKNRF